MRKYNKFSDVEKFELLRMDILSGNDEGVYMFESDLEIRLFLARHLFEKGTKLFFMEKTIENQYTITDMITV